MNLGHTFGHALEAAAGFGALCHGEAVAWGMARACELGVALGITPERREKEIMEILKLYGYETTAPHPLANQAGSADILIRAMQGDKKAAAGKLRFIVPAAESAQIVSLSGVSAAPEKTAGEDLLRKILNGECAA